MGRIQEHRHKGWEVALSSFFTKSEKRGNRSCSYLQKSVLSKSLSSLFLKVRLEQNEQISLFTFSGEIHFL